MAWRYCGGICVIIDRTTPFHKDALKDSLCSQMRGNILIAFHTAAGSTTAITLSHTTDCERGRLCVKEGMMRMDVLGLNTYLAAAWQSYKTLGSSISDHVNNRLF